ncbi:MAG: PadR family transcriptional regulator [Pseudonocardiaceae bacterium]
MTGPIRITGPLLDVVEVFLQAFNEDALIHGWAIAKATKRSGPTVYGVLDRLEDAGWITGQWEDQHSESNKPRRRLYRLTPTGLTAARDLLATRRPQALHRDPRPHQVRPEPGLAFVGWLRTLLPGGAP